MKKRELDPGLKYLKTIKLERIRGEYGFKDRLVELFGKEEAFKKLKILEDLERGTKEFYDFKNSSYDLSMAFAADYDCDLIRKACNYISGHKDYFGKTILEVGCESGNMTGFLALEFPDSKIISIDRNESAIAVAKQRIEQLNVENVEFRCCALEDIEETFDTVFCMRTIRENIDKSPFTGEPFLYQINYYIEQTNHYSQELIKRLGPDGKICVIDRCGREALMCGWMVALNDSNCGYINDTYEEIACEEIHKETIFQAFISKPGVENDPMSIINLWYAAVKLDLSNLKVNCLTGWNALVYLHENAGELIKGAYILDQSDEVIGRFCLFTDCDDPDMLYYLSSTYEDSCLYYTSKDEKDIAIKKIQENIDYNVNKGSKYRDIDPAKDYIEGQDE